MIQGESVMKKTMAILLCVCLLAACGPAMAESPEGGAAGLALQLIGNVVGGAEDEKASAAGAIGTALLSLNGAPAEDAGSLPDALLGVDALVLQAAEMNGTPAEDAGSPLDALFEADALVLQPAEISAPAAEDFVLSQEAMSAAAAGGMTLNPIALSALLTPEQTVLLSRSPAGNSSLLTVAKMPVCEYNGKYHLLYISAKGVPDEYGKLERFMNSVNRNFASIFGDEGVVYSPDGRYAALFDRQAYMKNYKLICDPVLLDLSTGEVILTAAYSDNARDGGAAVIGASFSPDGKYFYYNLIGRFGDSYNRVCRYDLSAGTAEICLDSAFRLDYPSPAALPDGSLLMLKEETDNSAFGGIVRAVCNGGVWSESVWEYSVDQRFFAPRLLQYSAASGYALVTGRTMMNDGYCLHLFRPEEDMAGQEKFVVIPAGTGEAKVITAAQLEEDVYATGGASLPYEIIYYARFSPDGNYVLLNTVRGADRHLYMLRVSDLALREVRGVDAAGIQMGSFNTDYPQGIEWNGDTIFISMRDGVQAFTLKAE